MMELREVVRNFYVFFFHGLPLLSSVSVSDHLQTTIFICLIVFYQAKQFFSIFSSLKDLKIWIDLKDLDRFERFDYVDRWFSPKATTFAIWG